MSIEVCVDSKSSIYARPALPTTLECPGISCANSAFTAMVDGLVALTNGILLITFVSHCDSARHEVFSPQMVFEIGSFPVLTLVVSGISDRCIIVPPRLKSLSNLYSKCVPSRVLRCMLNID